MNRDSFAALCTATVIALGVGASSNCQAGVFQPGEFITYSQDSWGATPSPGNAAQLLFDNFDSVYPGGLEVGVSGTAGFSNIFTSGPAVLNYLPAGGAPGSLSVDQIDPTSDASGVFGGHVLALELNVDFSDLGLLVGSAGVLIGDLVLHDLPTQLTEYNDLTVREFLSEMNFRLGGGGGGVPTYDAISLLTEDISRAFEDGTPSQFAQDHLMVIPAPGSIAALAMLVVPGLGRPHRRRAA